MKIGRYGSDGALIEAREAAAGGVLDPPLVCERGDYVLVPDGAEAFAFPAAASARTITSARRI